MKVDPARILAFFVSLFLRLLRIFFGRLRGGEKEREGAGAGGEVF